jgi:hypothetical protein
MSHGDEAGGRPGLGGVQGTGGLARIKAAGR